MMDEERIEILNLRENDLLVISIYRTDLPIEIELKRTGKIKKYFEEAIMEMGFENVKVHVEPGIACSKGMMFTIVRKDMDVM